MFPLNNLARKELSKWKYIHHMYVYLTLQMDQWSYGMLMWNTQLMHSDKFCWSMIIQLSTSTLNGAILLRLSNSWILVNFCRALRNIWVWNFSRAVGNFWVWNFWICLLWKKSFHYSLDIWSSIHNTISIFPKLLRRRRYYQKVNYTTEQNHSNRDENYWCLHWWYIRVVEYTEAYRKWPILCRTYLLKGKVFAFCITFHLNFFILWHITFVSWTRNFY